MEYTEDSKKEEITKKLSEIKMPDIEDLSDVDPVYTTKLLRPMVYGEVKKDFTDNRSFVWWSKEDTVCLDLEGFEGLGEGVLDAFESKTLELMETVSRVVRELYDIDSKVYVEVKGFDSIEKVDFSNINSNHFNNVISTELQVGHTEEPRMLQLSSLYRCQNGHQTVKTTDRGEEVRNPLRCRGDEDCRATPYRRVSRPHPKILSMTCQKFIATNPNKSDANARRIAGEFDKPFINNISVRDSLNVIARVREIEDEESHDTPFYLHILGCERSENRELTEKDKRRLNKLSDEIEPLEDLTEPIGSEYGLKDKGSGQLERCWKMLLLCSVKGHSNIASNHNIHMMVMGRSGSGKSKSARSMLNILNDSSQFVNLEKATEAGVIGSNVRSEALGGRFMIEAGAVTQSSGGICVVDEFDKVERMSEQNIFGEPMEDKEVKITKTAKGSLPADTSFIMTANPEGHSYSKTPLNDVKLSNHIEDRLDIITRVDPYQTNNYGDDLEKRKSDIQSSILAQREDSDDSIDRETLGLWIDYAREIEPYLTDEALNEITDVVVQLEHGNYRSSGRLNDSIVNLSTAVCKLRLSDEVSKQDVIDAKELYIDCWDSVLDRTED